MAKQHKVALIGCGRRARMHGPALRDDGRCQIVAVSDIKREAAEAMKADFGFDGATIYTDHREMLDKERPEVVVTCLWTPLHLPVFKDCVAAGVKAVLSEKPMAPTWGECQEMARLAEASGCQLTFCHQRRFGAGNLLARKLIAEGRFGQPLRMDLSSPRNLLDCGTHTLDQAMSMINETPAKWVLGAVDASEIKRSFDVPSEAMAIGLVVFQNGVRAYIQVGGTDLDIWGGVRFIGTEGFVELMWDGQWKNAVIYKEPDWVPPTVEANKDAHIPGVVRNALDCLESGAEPELSHKKALRAAEIIFALYESVRRHARVELPLTTTDNAFATMVETGAFGPRPV